MPSTNAFELAIRRTAVWQAIRLIRRRVELWKWERGGRRDSPPPLAKQRIVKAYGKVSGLKALIETGTYRGDLVFACRRNFEHITTIELDEVLYAEAGRRFARFPHITVMRGDSGRVIPDLLKTVTGPALFWLDGHYCGVKTAKGPTDTPIAEELGAILRHPVDGHVVLIDDARCFDGANDYPTLDHLRNFVKRMRPDWIFEVAQDIIRMHRRQLR